MKYWLPNVTHHDRAVEEIAQNRNHQVQTEASISPASISLSPSVPSEVHTEIPTLRVPASIASTASVVTTLTGITAQQLAAVAPRTRDDIEEERLRGRDLYFTPLQIPVQIADEAFAPVPSQSTVTLSPAEVFSKIRHQH